MAPRGLTILSGYCGLLARKDYEGAAADQKNIGELSGKKDTEFFDA